MKILAKIKDYFSHKETPHWGFQIENMTANLSANYHSCLSKIKNLSDKVDEYKSFNLELSNQFLKQEKKIQELEKTIEKLAKKPKTKAKS